MLEVKLGLLGFKMFPLSDKISSFHKFNSFEIIECFAIV